jgi:uncharacterized membrane protein YraQ (UPF0718 family)
METITTFLKDFWALLAEMSPYLLLGFLVAGLVSVFLSSEFVRRHLGKRSFGAVVKASLFGVPLPLCSCGVMPVALSLKEAGAGNGAAVSFLISTPQTGIDSIAITYSLMGPVFAIIRPIAAFISGVLGGTVVNMFGGPEQKPEPQTCSSCSSGKSAEAKKPRGNIFVRALKFGFLHLPKETGRAMLIGLIAAALITALVPEDFFTSQVSSGFPMLLLMVLVGIPIYVCSSASVPIAVALLIKGISPGAALVFLMTGPASNAASYVVMWKQFGARCAVLYFVSVVVSALAAGMIVDYFALEMGVKMVNTQMAMPSPLLMNSSAVVLLALLLTGTWRELAGNKKQKD